MRKRKLLRLLTVLVLLLLPVSAAAQTGSLKIQGIQHPVALYQVINSEGYISEDFEDALPPVITDFAETAKALQTHAFNNHIAGQTMTPSQGEAFYPSVAMGGYLVCSLHSKGEFAPFLLEIPTIINGEYVYNVEAQPKLEEIPPETEPTEPEPTETEPTVTEPTVTEPTVTEPAVTEPTETKPPETLPPVTEPNWPQGGTETGIIPQTGSNQIPQYVLLALGTMVTLWGLYLVLFEREENTDD